MSGVPSDDNEISMIGIFSEKNEDDYTADNPEEFNISLKGLSVNGQNDSDGGNIDINANSTNKPDQLAPHGINEFSEYLHTASPPFTWGTNGGVSQGWGSASGVSPFTANATCSLGFAFQPNNDRVRVKSGNGNNSTAVSYVYNSVTYSGTDPDQVEFKIVWTGVFSGSYNSSYEASGSTSGTYYTMQKQDPTNDNGTFTMRNWFIQKSSGQGGAAYNAIGANSPQWTYKAKDSNGNVLGTSGTSSQNGISLSVTRGQQGGEFFCIHEDMLVDTASGPMTVRDVQDKDPKIWSWNSVKQEKELVDQIQNIIIPHNNLYIINDDFKITEDHIVYGKNGHAYAINPDKARENYQISADKMEIGCEFKTLSDDDVYIVESIEKLDGEHSTYTIGNENNNFFTNGILVDSEVRW